MTQKELLYVEDAINHEKYLLAYLNDASTLLKDKELVNFVNEEIKYHEKLQSKLTKLLEDNSNE